MTTLTIRIPTEATEKMSGFIKSLGGEIVSAEQTKKELRQDIIEAVTEMKLIITGKKQVRDVEDSLNAL